LATSSVAAKDMKNIQEKETKRDTQKDGVRTLKVAFDHATGTDPFAAG
jgi:hypothetical protein